MIKEFSTYINESNDFNVGDVVYYYGTESRLHGEKVKIIRVGSDCMVRFFKKEESTRCVDKINLLRKKKEIKRLYTQDDPYGEEEVDEKWNPFKKDKPQPIKTFGPHSDVDPYGEEDWDEPKDLTGKFYKLEREGRYTKIYYNYRNNKYMLVFHKIEYPSGECNFALAPSFEYGFINFGSGKFEYLPKMYIDDLEEVNDDELTEIMDKLESENPFVKASDIVNGDFPRSISNLDLLKRKFHF